MKHIPNGVQNVSVLIHLTIVPQLIILLAISFLPQVEQGTVKLLDQKTWFIIDEHVQTFPFIEIMGI